ncbi:MULTISPECIES: SDR family oxidoreductase [unclassified Luteococcus]|uniref:SDR family oxidoreductase n=1 Tax=unclassified Luteococcus TaxID=2639923 RepID=UPI00313D7EEE
MTHEIAVLIGTGSIGVAIARQAAVGRTLLLADRDEEQLQARAEELRNEGFTVETQTVDVSDRDAVETLAQRADELGAVTRVIHAAGVSPNQASPQQIVAVDLLGTVYVLEAFGAVIGDRGSGIVIASQAGHMGSFPAELERQLAFASADELAQLPALAEVSDSGAAYILAKRANALRVQAAAVSWGDRRARVNCLSPGIISTPLGRHEMEGPQAEGYRLMLETSPAGRMGTPAEIGNLAAFLLDERGAFITGSDILCDGGVIAAMRAGRIG